jgi:hypothetical protein
MVKREDDDKKNGLENEEFPSGSDHRWREAEHSQTETASQDGKSNMAHDVAAGVPEGVEKPRINGETLRRSAVIGLGGFSLVAASSTQSSASSVIPGSPGNDSIDGGTGNDTLLGFAGDDTISGGAGNDSIDGGSGNDRLFGGEGNDTILGGIGDDFIDGGAGSDQISGGSGNDTIQGATPGDVTDGGSGDNTLDLSGLEFDTFEIVRNPDDDTTGTINFFDPDGVGTGSASFSNIGNIIPCFTPGTRIATPRGERAVEDLRVGDRVITRDNGLQEIRWIGHRALTAPEVQAAPHLRPILIRAGALGRGLPLHDMLVSPQHRMLINSERAALYFEDREVLASATHLTDMAGVDRMAAQATTYVHFLFDQHEVVLSNGAWSESFQPGAQVLGAMGEAQRDEIFELFPDLQDLQGVKAYQAARRSLKRHEARLLVA